MAKLKLAEAETTGAFGGALYGAWCTASPKAANAALSFISVP